MTIYLNKILLKCKHFKLANQISYKMLSPSEVILKQKKNLYNFNICYKHKILYKEKSLFIYKEHPQIVFLGNVFTLVNIC